MCILVRQALSRIKRLVWQLEAVPRRRALSSATDEVLTTVEQGVATITLNRPKALNALTLGMVRSLEILLTQWSNDPQVKVVVVKGAGEKAFCAGGDVVSVRKSALEDPEHPRGQPGTVATDFFREEYQVNYRIFTAQKPQVSLWDGFVMGGGVGVSIGSKFRVATEKTVFAMPETAIGFFPDVGGTYWLPRLPEGLGQYIGLTGTRMKAADLLYSGIATHYVPSARLDEVEAALRKLCGSGEGVQGLEQAIDEILRQFGGDHKDMASALAKNRKAIDASFAGKTRVEEIVSSLEGMVGGSDEEWAKATLKVLSRMSPTALKVTHRALREGGKMGLKENFVVEYRLSQAFMDPKSDFMEGVRALLVDKDNQPQWKPATLSEVSEPLVDRYFSSLGDYDLQLK